MLVNESSIVQRAIQNKNGIIKHVNMDVKVIVSEKIIMKIVSIQKVLLIRQ